MSVERVKQKLIRLWQDTKASRKDPQPVEWDENYPTDLTCFMHNCDMESETTDILYLDNIDPKVHYMAFCKRHLIQYSKTMSYLEGYRDAITQMEISNEDIAAAWIMKE